jgi:hypothetical protein
MLFYECTYNIFGKMKMTNPFSAFIAKADTAKLDVVQLANAITEYDNALKELITLRSDVKKNIASDLLEGKRPLNTVYHSVSINQKIVSTNNWWTLWTTSQGLLPNNTRHGVSLALSLSIA